MQKIQLKDVQHNIVYDGKNWGQLYANQPGMDYHTIFCKNEDLCTSRDSRVGRIKNLL